MPKYYPNTTTTNYPFGMRTKTTNFQFGSFRSPEKHDSGLMPGRTYSSEGYSWGFNGKEKDAIARAKKSRKGLESGRHGEWKSAATKDLREQANLSKKRGDLPELYEPLLQKAERLSAEAKGTNHRGGRTGGGSKR